MCLPPSHFPRMAPAAPAATIAAAVNAAAGSTAATTAAAAPWGVHFVRGPRAASHYAADWSRWSSASPPTLRGHSGPPCRWPRRDGKIIDGRRVRGAAIGMQQATQQSKNSDSTEKGSRHRLKSAAFLAPTIRARCFPADHSLSPPPSCTLCVGVSGRSTDTKVGFCSVRPGTVLLTIGGANSCAPPWPAVTTPHTVWSSSVGGF